MIYISCVFAFNLGKSTQGNGESMENSQGNV